MATKLMVRNNGIGPIDKSGRFSGFCFVEASFALQKVPLQALFNYLLEVVLNRLSLLSWEVWRNSLEEGRGEGEPARLAAGPGYLFLRLGPGCWHRQCSCFSALFSSLAWG